MIIGLFVDFVEVKNKCYFVVFVMDGYWDFVKINSIKGSLVYDKMVFDFIIVVIGYVGENFNYGELCCCDLLFVVFLNMMVEMLGWVVEFLELIEKMIILLVECDYWVDLEWWVLVGVLMGGLFVFYSLYMKLEFFCVYIVVILVMIIGGDWIFGYEEVFVKLGWILDVWLYFIVGEKEGGDFW